MPHPLPDKLSNPAKRALANAQIKSLDDLAHYTEKQIGALHGVRPSTIRPLREAMAEAGISYKQS